MNPLDLLDLLIIGAGPTGLAAAIEAARHGLRVRVVDQLPEPVARQDERLEGVIQR